MHWRSLAKVMENETVLATTLWTSLFRVHVFNFGVPTTDMRSMTIGYTNVLPTIVSCKFQQSSLLISGTYYCQVSTDGCTTSSLGY